MTCGLYGKSFIYRANPFAILEDFKEAIDGCMDMLSPQQLGSVVAEFEDPLSCVVTAEEGSFNIYCMRKCSTLRFLIRFTKFFYRTGKRIYCYVIQMCLIVYSLLHYDSLTLYNRSRLNKPPFSLFLF